VRFVSGQVIGRRDQATTAMPPLLCLEGVFGSGKSHTLSSIVVNTIERAKNDDSNDIPRILVLGATNSAVDSVLVKVQRQFQSIAAGTGSSNPANPGSSSLHDQDPSLRPAEMSSSSERHMDAVARVGSIRRVAKSLLPCHLSASDDAVESDLRELASMRARLQIHMDSTVKELEQLPITASSRAKAGHLIGNALSELDILDPPGQMRPVEACDTSDKPTPVAADEDDDDWALVERDELLVRLSELREEAGQLDLALGRATDRKKRRVRLAAASVVGSTLAASSFEVLQGARFDVIVLDEASQVVEPTAVAAMIQFGARFAVTAGDSK